MILSIIALCINITASVMNHIVARRNRKRADALAAAERDRESKRTPRTYRIDVEMLDPTRIADPELRHAVIIRRLMSNYCPN